MASSILENAAILPAEANDDENNYPLLGYLVWYSLRDIRITRDQLVELFEIHNIDKKHLPLEIKGSQAFRRASTQVATYWKKRFEKQDDGTYLNVMIRNVIKNDNRIVKHIIVETRNPEQERLFYGRVGILTYLHEPDTLTIDVEDKYKKVAEQIKEEYETMRACYTGKAFRDIVRKFVMSTTPVCIRPTGGVYFMPQESKFIINGLEGLVKDINQYGVTNTEEAVFESVPVLDIEKQRKLIFDKYEAQNTLEVDSTLDELAELLKSDKKITKATATKYTKIVQGLQDGITRYESLLGMNLDKSKTRTDILNMQVMELIKRVQA